MICITKAMARFQLAMSSEQFHSLRKVKVTTCTLPGSHWESLVCCTWGTCTASWWRAPPWTRWTPPGRSQRCPRRACFRGWFSNAAQVLLYVTVAPVVNEIAGQHHPVGNCHYGVTHHLTLNLSGRQFNCNWKKIPAPRLQFWMIGHRKSKANANLWHLGNELYFEKTNREKGNTFWLQFLVGHFQIFWDLKI